MRTVKTKGEKSRSEDKHRKYQEHNKRMLKQGGTAAERGDFC